MSNSDVIRILPDGKIMIERGEHSSNERLFEVLSPYVTDKEKLKNFLFQWKDRQIICGMADLCG